MDEREAYAQALAQYAGEFVGMVISSMNQLAHSAADDTDASLADLAEAPLVQMVGATQPDLPKAAADGVAKSMALASHAILAVALMHLAPQGMGALHAFTRDLEAFCGVTRTGDGPSPE